MSIGHIALTHNSSEAALLQAIEDHPHLFRECFVKSFAEAIDAEPKGFWEEPVSYVCEGYTQSEINATLARARAKKRKKGGG